MNTTVKLVVFYCCVILVMLFAVKMSEKAVITLSESKISERDNCIIIDPGHGGEDGGAAAPTGLPESTYNLEISLKLNDLLNLLGFQTKMTRTTDTAIYTKGDSLSQKKASDLRERVRMANETEGAVVLSIHQNHFPDKRYSGAQVFYGKNKDSEQLAKQLQSAFVTTVNPGSNRQAKRSSGIYLLEHIGCTGVLIECGFLSNPLEETKLRDPDYQRKLCCVIAVTMCRFLSNT